MAIPGLVVPKGWCCIGKEFLKGEPGRGRWLVIPLKLNLIGVFGADCVVSSAGGGGRGRLGVGTGARGVVGVVASVE